MLHLERFLAHEAFRLHFETFSAFETSGVSLWELLSSWNLWGFTLRDSQQPRELHFERFSFHGDSGVSLFIDSQLMGSRGLHFERLSGNLWGYTLRDSQLMRLLGVSHWKILSSWILWGYTLRNSQLMKPLVLHFERFLVHEESGASLWQILSSRLCWFHFNRFCNSWCFINSWGFALQKRNLQRLLRLLGLRFDRFSLMKPLHFKRLSAHEISVASP